MINDCISLTRNKIMIELFGIDDSRNVWGHNNYLERQIWLRQNLDIELNIHRVISIYFALNFIKDRIVFIQKN